MKIKLSKKIKSDISIFISYLFLFIFLYFAGFSLIEFFLIDNINSIYFGESFSERMLKHIARLIFGFFLSFSLYILLYLLYIFFNYLLDLLYRFLDYLKNNIEFDNE